MIRTRDIIPYVIPSSGNITRYTSDHRPIISHRLYNVSSLLRNPHNVIRVTEDKQTLFRSGVGMLLYLVKYSRPDIANAVRQMSKVLDGATPAAYKEMMRIIKYVLDTKNLALKVKPMQEDEEQK